MSNDAITVTVEVAGGPEVAVPWTQGMNAQQALEEAYNAIGNTEEFTYGIQYFGTKLGYLVFMINETYDTFISSSEPFFYWEFLVNGEPSSTGVDSTILNAGDVVGFVFEQYEPVKHSKSLLRLKHDARRRGAGAP